MVGNRNRVLVVRIVGFALIYLLSIAVQAAPDSQSEIEAALQLRPDLTAGEHRYVSACRKCHGEAGEGQPRGLVPRIAGQRYTVVVTELAGYRHGRRMDDRMQVRASRPYLVDAQDIANVSAYVAQLRTGWAARGPGRFVESGAQLFVSRCIGCHGVGAEGSDLPVVPRLATQNYGYLIRQLREIMDGRRARAGRDHLEPLTSLAEDQISGIADYLSRLP